ncbi:hypothetical protein O7608_18215 [Solwaraspora sp. WMMA2056]|uniref:hypothetical protein n=1 Tax=Solwaraspora sp. WMMA2056 TaxID=3015161 RepID=UPI00259B154D|nr:hypothetical protein [Solwaraspora sp. WMMA2056]WJK38439.1 hypothetical protein O7608_18215 [Solwaraspora sp. WMMA2056]
MSDEKLTSVETAALFILLTEAGEALNVKLAQEHGCKLEKRSREKLEKLRLIQVGGTPRRLVLRLTEAGRDRCRAEFAAGSPPPRSGPMGGALYALLLTVDRFLTAQGLSLGDFVTASNAPVADDLPAVPAAPAAAEPTSAEPALDERAVEERVRAAYWKVAPQAGDLVDLADLRDLVDDLDRADVDAALRRLHRQRGVTLVPEANQKSLDPRIKAAAVVIGDQAKHMISMVAS